MAGHNAWASTSGSRQSCRGYRGGPRFLLEVPIGFFCFDVLLHEVRNDFVLLDQLLFELLDPLLFELVDLGLGPLG
jgi:hypothetical protein